MTGPAVAFLEEANAGLAPDQVEAWLRANPEFLARRPALYRELKPPRRVHGERIADHMAAMLEAERVRTRALEAEVRDALDAGRAGAALTLRVRLAVLALMRTQDVPEAVTQELPALLGVETCTLAAEPPERPGVPWLRYGILPLSRGSVARLIGPGRDVVVRATPTETEALHAEAAPLVARDALARVPLTSGPPMLIAIGARDANALPARQTAPTLAFLGRAVAAALSR